MQTGIAFIRVKRFCAVIVLFYIGILSVRNTVPIKKQQTGHCGAPLTRFWCEYDELLDSK